MSVFFNSIMYSYFSTMADCLSLYQIHCSLNIRPPGKGGGAGERRHTKALHEWAVLVDPWCCSHWLKQKVSVSRLAVGFFRTTVTYLTFPWMSEDFLQLPVILVLSCTM